jgi:hypothetical protein
LSGQIYLSPFIICILAIWFISSLMRFFFIVL